MVKNRVYDKLRSCSFTANSIYIYIMLQIAFLPGGQIDTTIVFYSCQRGNPVHISDAYGLLYSYMAV